MPVPETSGTNNNYYVSGLGAEFEARFPTANERENEAELEVRSPADNDTEARTEARTEPGFDLQAEIAADLHGK